MNVQLPPLHHICPLCTFSFKKKNVICMRVYLKKKIFFFNRSSTKSYNVLETVSKKHDTKNYKIQICKKCNNCYD